MLLPVVMPALTVAQVGEADAPADVRTCPLVPKLTPEPTPIAWLVFKVNAIVPLLDANCNIPDVSPVATNAEPAVVPAEMLDAMIYLYNTNQRCPLETVTDTPEPKATGPTENALYPAAIV